jgi:hypothetical protein
MVNENSHFMTLPPELRILIYQHVAQSDQYLERTKIHVANRVPKGLKAPPSIALTQVNRLIRQESVPILYQDSTITISTRCMLDRKYTDRWARELIDTAVLESTTTYELYPIRICSYWIHIDLQNSAEQAVQFSNSHKPVIPCRWAEACAMDVGRLVKGLDCDGSGRYIMVKATMKIVVVRMCEANREADREIGTEYNH